MKFLIGLLVSLMVFTLLACGGGVGAATLNFAKPKVSITWGPRSRSIDGPSSAQSAVIVFLNASITNTNVTMNVDRTGPASGSTVIYTGTENIKVTPVSMTVTFYADPGGTGAIVGTASGSATVSSDGTVSTSITTVGTVNSVDIPAGQSILVGTTKTLSFGAHDSQNNLIAVSPGSAVWAIISGSDKVSFANGDATGIAFGAATVTATVDGKTSPTTSIVVPAGTFVTIARQDGPESGLAWSTNANLSADGATIAGRIIFDGSGHNTPAYWDTISGWTQLPHPANTGSGFLTSSNHDSSYLAGYIDDSLGVTTYYLWPRSGPAKSLWSFITSTGTQRLVRGISSDGQTLYVAHEDGNAKSYDIGSSTFTSLVGSFNLLTVSENGMVLGGNQIISQTAVGTMWTQAGGVETIPGTASVEFVSADANYASGRDDNGSGYYWSRSGGLKRIATSTVLCMSADGKYVVYSDNVRRDVFIWDVVKGERSLTPALRSAAGDNQIEFYNGSSMSISSDGKKLAGIYSKPVNGGGTGLYVFYATFSSIP